MANVKKLIDDYLAQLPEWQQQNLAMFRELIHKIEPNVVEEWKWSVPVFMVNKKLISAMSSFKEHTKFNFFEGASLPDVNKLFNSGLDSQKHRSINLAQGEVIDARKLEKLIGEAVNRAKQHN